MGLPLLLYPYNIDLKLRYKDKGLGVSPDITNTISHNLVKVVMKK